MEWQPTPQSWLTEKQKEAYYKVFASFDSDGDGNLNVSELIQLMKYIGEYNRNFKGQDTLKCIDPKDTGLVEFQEFLFLLQLTCCDENKVADAAFKVLDPSGDGVITIDSLKKACTNIGVEISEDEITTLVTEADPEGSGALDFQEFKSHVQETVAAETPVQNDSQLSFHTGTPRSGVASLPSTWITPRQRQWNVASRLHEKRTRVTPSEPRIVPSVAPLSTRISGKSKQTWK